MGAAKALEIRPIPSQVANAFVRRVHYSGKVAPNSQLHLGVFWNGRLEGAMQFGPSLDKSKIIGLVRGTGWNQFLELNRLAFTDVLPRNSESRALGVAFRMMRRLYPHIKWVVSFADATQCGDGTIYRAAGFVLTAVRRNNSLWELPDDGRFDWLGTKTKAGRRLVHLIAPSGRSIVHEVSTRTGKAALDMFQITGGAASTRPLAEAGARVLDGFQLRYIYFLDPTWRERLTVPELPYSAIVEAGAKMYRGVRQADRGAGKPMSEGGATPTLPLEIADD